MQKSFIETQFPVSKISKESYKERKAVQGQTLTGLGKWWGRKPLIMVRATLLGLLMPSSNDLKKDREIFLKILSMDDQGLLERKNKSIPIALLFSRATDNEKAHYFINTEEVVWKPGITSAEKLDLQRAVFLRMGYDEKLIYSRRPEELDNIVSSSWDIINNHLGTNAKNLQELIGELSTKTFGRIITVGDCFAGGGSIPFEASRMGLYTYGSDLNPVATLLTWSSQNIGITKDQIAKLNQFQKNVYTSVDEQIINWGIEQNAAGDRANCYLYCIEVNCPACGWKIPLSPTWIIGMGSKTIAILIPKENDKSYKISIKMDASNQEILAAEEAITIRNDGLNCLKCKTVSPITSLRRDMVVDGKQVNGLRRWEKNDFIPRSTDKFQERLYCIRYTKIINKKPTRYYTAPSDEDLIREQKVVKLLKECFTEWQDKGYIPSGKIEIGDKTDEPIRTRGWLYWHQLFNPRQLLTNGLFIKEALKTNDKTELALATLGINKIADWNSKLCRWGTGQARESAAQTFYNQALNSVYNYPVRALGLLEDIWSFELKPNKNLSKSTVEVLDARKISTKSHIWITDPPYADAVNYHELSEFFLAWDKKILKKAFPSWYTDSHRKEAVQGSDSVFTHAMIGVYKNLTKHMPDDGSQVVMFTHQDPAVWAELSLILWSAGLQVTAAWNIATETDASGLKSGNYVKGTVLLVLRKNLSSKNGWLDEIYPQIKNEVKEQIDSMRDLDNLDDPDFTDNDYLLAAYAASLKVLTGYSSIGDINIDYELARTRDKNTKSPIQEIIESAVKIAFDLLIPKTLSKNTWKDLTKEEKFYIKALEFERSGNFALSSYQELARGLGVSDYTYLLASTKANSARVKTPIEFTNKHLNISLDFSKTLTRQVLMSIYVAAKAEDATNGKNWLRNEVPNYWTSRDKIIEILNMILAFENVAGAEHWVESVKYAVYIKSLVENDGI